MNPLYMLVLGGSVVFYGSMYARSLSVQHARKEYKERQEDNDKIESELKHIDINQQNIFDKCVNNKNTPDFSKEAKKFKHFHYQYGQKQEDNGLVISPISFTMTALKDDIFFKFLTTLNEKYAFQCHSFKLEREFDRQLKNIRITLEGSFIHKKPV
jgi:hypothetical protein